MQVEHVHDAEAAVGGLIPAAAQLNDPVTAGAGLVSALLGCGFLVHSYCCSIEGASDRAASAAPLCTIVVVTLMLNTLVGRSLNARAFTSAIGSRIFPVSPNDSSLSLFSALMLNLSLEGSFGTEDLVPRNVLEEFNDDTGEDAEGEVEGCAPFIWGGASSIGSMISEGFMKEVVSLSGESPDISTSSTSTSRSTVFCFFKAGPPSSSSSSTTKADLPFAFKMPFVSECC